jgi:hypothetical protein
VIKGCRTNKKYLSNNAREIDLDHCSKKGLKENSRESLDNKTTERSGSSEYARVYDREEAERGVCDEQKKVMWWCEGRKMC